MASPAALRNEPASRPPPLLLISIVLNELSILSHGHEVSGQLELGQLDFVDRGFVAVSATNLRGVYFDDRWRNFYWPLLEMKPAGVIGYSIYVYWVERRWWP